MKELQTLKFAFLLLLLSIGQISSSQTMKDTLKTIRIEGIFNANKTFVGNFNRVEVYKIDRYCISTTAISQAQADSLDGKKIMVTGKLKIVKGRTFPALETGDGTIYEPYKEPDKKFISEPKFKIIE